MGKLRKKLGEVLNLLQRQMKKIRNFANAHSGTFCCPTTQAISSQQKKPSFCPRYDNTDSICNLTSWNIKDK